MPEPNTFLLRALADDPLMSMSLLPNNELKLDINTGSLVNSGVNLLHASESSFEAPAEVSDSDLPSSVVEEIEVCNSMLSELNPLMPVAVLSDCCR